MTRRTVIGWAALAAFVVALWFLSAWMCDSRTNAEIEFLQSELALEKMNHETELANCRMRLAAALED